MKIARVALTLAATAVLLAAAPGYSQTRLAVSGGVLVPFGDLGDSTDPSLRLALRGELRTVNALGQASPLAFGLYGAYSSLSVDSELEDALMALGIDPDPDLLEIGADVRAYSRSAPFFVGGGAGYARFTPVDGSDALHGVDLHVGAGFLLPLGMVFAEPEVTGHVVLLEDDSFQFLAATLGFALPF